MASFRTVQVYLPFIFLFFYQGFLSRTMATHRTAGEVGEPFFIPLYLFCPLTNIQTFVCNFACEMTITYFWSHPLNLSNCYSMRFTTWSNYHLIDWWCEVRLCLFTWWFDTRFLLQQFWHGKPVDSKSHRLSPLFVLQQTD